MANRIGDKDTGLYFLTMSTPRGRTRQMVIESRFGINDYGVYQSGIKGEQSTVRTTADTEDFAASQVLYESYKGSALYKILYDQEDLVINEEPYRVLVLDVQVQKESLMFAVGALTDDPTALIHASWTLLAVPAS